MTAPREDRTPTREELIALCERGSVLETQWHDRDSEGAQRQLGECLMLLRAGCAFTVEPEIQHDCYWVEITSKGFQYFEIGEMSVDTRYVPTEKRLRERAGRDWY